MLSVFVFFKQKTAYEMRISDWSSDVCSSDLVALPDDGGVVLLGRQVAVDAVVAGVGGAVGEPPDVNVVRPEAGILHLGIGLEPVQALAVLAPEPFRIRNRLFVELEIEIGRAHV